jgi:hypothetical protein
MQRFLPPVAAAVLILLPAAALADGAFVWRKGVDLHEPQQKAILYWHAGREVMVLQVKYEGPAEEFGWMVPMPSQPEVDAIKPEDSPFAEISLYTQQRLRWGLRSKGESAGEEQVAVLERKVAGVYDVAVLAATDAGALAGWLEEHGFAFPRERQDVLDHYVRKRWVYAAMRIDPKQLAGDEVRKLRTGQLQPVRFTFRTSRMVYPLHISSVNAGETEVLLYLLAQAPMVLADGPAGGGFDLKANTPRFRMDWNCDPRYGTYRKATADELPKTWKAIGTAAGRSLHLMKYRGRYTAAAMTDDLAFAAMKPQRRTP